MNITKLHVACYASIILLIALCGFLPARTIVRGGPTAQVCLFVTKLLVANVAILVFFRKLDGLNCSSYHVIAKWTEKALILFFGCAGCGDKHYCTRFNWWSPLRYPRRICGTDCWRSCGYDTGPLHDERYLDCFRFHHCLSYHISGPTIRWRDYSSRCPQLCYMYHFRQFGSLYLDSCYHSFDRRSWRGGSRTLWTPGGNCRYEEQPSSRCLALK